MLGNIRITQDTLIPDGAALHDKGAVRQNIELNKVIRRHLDARSQLIELIELRTQLPRGVHCSHRVGFRESVDALE
ncbi:hypothetical protein [Myxococcus hansupus]|uniref:hypothetical protein n=1 Tax=Pseudomyxococcus hansupus TaxID=1297742 RepID=UPI0005D12F53|nr:hypothetical protein [Myxococcus hansupus]